MKKFGFNEEIPGKNAQISALEQSIENTKKLLNSLGLSVHEIESLLKNLMKLEENPRIDHSKIPQIKNLLNQLRNYQTSLDALNNSEA